MITIKVNGTPHQVDMEPDTPLLWVLRDVIGLTGTKFGCGIAECGACTVHINGEAMRSCSVPISLIDGAEITTIEETCHPDRRTPVLAGFARRGRAAVRLLPVRPDHGDGGVPEELPEADGRRDRRQHHEYLPLRNL